LKDSIRKYYKIGLAILFTLSFIAYYFSVFSDNYKPSIVTFREKFSDLESKLDHFMEENVHSLKSSNLDKIWLKSKDWDEINLHVYQGDSLIYWNTNQLPILRYADIHFPSNGILHLQNGWYYAKLKEVNGLMVCASFIVKQDYSYENKELTNEFPVSLEVPFTSYITFQQENGYPIYSINKEYLFSINPNDYQTATSAESICLMVLLLTSIYFWLLSLFQVFKNNSSKVAWSILVGLVALRLLSVKFIWFGFMHDTESFQPSLYGTNEWFPNFFEYLVNCLVISFVFLAITSRIVTSKLFKSKSYWVLGLLFFSFPFWIFLLYLNKGLIENSSIPLVIEKLFSLNIYSVFALASIGLLFYVFYQLLKAIVKICFEIKISFAKVLGLGLFLGLSFFVYQLTFGHQLLFASLLPLLVILIIIVSVYKENKSQVIGIGLLNVFLFSLFVALNLGEFNRRKEKIERELYANQLATEKDIVTELEYAAIVPKIKEDEFLNRLINSPREVNVAEFEDGLERRIFNGFWERYEIGFHLFNDQNQSIINQQTAKSNEFRMLNNIILRHGSKSEIDSNIIFINDYTGHYSYIISQPLFSSDSCKSVLICTLKSKKIPEEIGFPRLLISPKAKVFEPLQNYSIAKYYDSYLVTKYGNFNYPSSDLALNHWKKIQTGFSNSDGYSHYMLRKTKKDVVVLSSKNFTMVELFTSFSYLFSFYGILLLPALFRMNGRSIFPKSLTLSAKIQIVLISLVFLSLVAFGWGSGIFVGNQYHEYTNDLIREKLNSVKSELADNVSDVSEISIQNDGNTLQLVLQKLSKIFVTDVNLYDKKGFLISTSRPKVYNIGLISEQMNPNAFFQMDIKDKSEFIHQENIGKLNYSSAYSPLYNATGDLLGYINLQHFSQQKEFENQIQKFLVAIINVFMILLAISIVISIFVSNWVTSPLRIIQDSFSKIKFGKQNQQILYTKEDEIGALVKDYNQKLSELEYAASQLAKNERESAWREMAKQVAHEIKNPLTPMKLSVQQLQRVYDPNDPNSEMKLHKVTNSIIEQIDALAKIANEFSSFAKMPKPNEAQLDLLPILENVIEVFKEDEMSQIILKTELKECLVLADKDMILRVFNNLIKNALQAVVETRKGVVCISVEVEADTFLFKIHDNGIGISADQHDKLFVPYFTTKSTGTGLGLAMVKQIVEIHRGSIWFESIENEGTTFYFTLPKRI